MADTTDQARLAAAREANAEGMAALRAGNAALAVEAFRRATAHDPLAGALWRNLAHALRDSGDDKGELAILNQALDLDRTDFVAQLRKAQNLQRIGDEEEALSAWTGALQLALGIENPVPGLDAELQIGRDFVAEMQRRIGTDADLAYAELDPVLDETERRRVRAFYDHSIGRRRVYFNECAGLYYPFLPADEYFDFKHFPWLAELEAATDDIRAELHGLLEEGNPAIIPYVQMEPGAPQNKWSPLSHNYDWSACFLYEYGQPNQPVLERCPKTAALLKRLPLQQIPGKAPNAFFSMLKPHSAIPAHTGVTNTRAIVHLALDVPPDCGFRVGGETRPWVEGKAFAFDDSIDHEAWNNSDQRRHILIIDTWNPHLTTAEQQAIVRYFEATGRSLARP
ncbi:aspartyl/asparaginyl beta-hydroxylase domain-containing protein [Novosphingobium sp. B 225]|uniref:aspartyl/asparaginyl beta-hydroxylase domain-containing protein n=1 Tax=Novosphingobium sp. B 225 TaxID=1961849 RepID=UPI000B4ACF30|nr:aspartyl/asparaginyl beta-hydroxylase domain-containing protein [Novosphingobium sp. B 225]